MDEFSPKAQSDALEHLLFKLNQITNEAERVAEVQEASIATARSHRQYQGHEESAEFNRALAVLASRVAGDVKQKYGAES